MARQITVKYNGNCSRCGAMIKRGTVALYEPATKGKGQILHVDCDQRAVNDYAGDGLDMRWEDQGAEICGR